MYKFWCLLWTLIICLCSNNSFTQENTSPHTPAQSYYQEAEDFKKSRKFTDAHLSIEQALQLAHSSENWEFYIKSLNLSARIFAAEKASEKRFSTLLFSLKAANEYLTCDNPQRAYILKHLGEVYLSRQKADSCQSFLNQAATIFHKKSLWKDYSWCKTLMAVSCYHAKSYEDMELYLDAAHEIAQKHLNKQESIFPSLYQLQTALYYQLGEYGKALEVGLNTLELRKLPEDSSLFQKYHADDFNNVASIYNFLGDQEHALEYHLQALKVRKQLFAPRHKALIQSYVNLGLAYKRSQKFELARSYLLKALARSKGESTLPASLRIKALQNIASLYRDLGKTDSALYFLDSAFDLHRDEPDDQERSYRILGLTYKEKGEHTLALESLEKSLNYSLETRREGHPFVAHSYEYIAQVYGELEQWDQALQNIEKALIAARATHFTLSDTENGDSLLPPDLIQASGLFKQQGEYFGKLANQKGQEKVLCWTKALNSFEHALHLIDNMRISDRQELALLHLSEKYQHTYELAIAAAYDLYKATGNSTYIVKAFQFAEKAKASVLLKSLRENDASDFAQIPDSMLYKEKTYLDRIRLFESKIYEEEQKQKINTLKISRWTDLVFRNKRAYEHLIRQLEQKYPKYYQIKYTQTIAGIEDLDRYLSQEEACISYFWGKEQVFVFAINRGKLKFHRIKHSDTLAQELHSFVAQISQKGLLSSPSTDRSSLESWTESSHKIFQKILAPVIPKHIKTCIILPDGPLSYLPFDILLTQKRQDTPKSYRNLPYLIKDYTLFYEYSATVLLRKEPNIVQDLHTFGGFAPSYVNTVSINKVRFESLASKRPQLQALFHNQQEVEQIAKVMSGKTFLGTVAQKTIAIEEAGNYKILHFASHGIIQGETPDYSGLFFTSTSPDWKEDFLSAAEIYTLNLNNWLTSLSACNTGKGKYMTGEGIFSLARAFKYAGSQNILMSQWQVDDASTRKIMVSFYQELQTDMPLADALRKAKLDYLKKSPRPHPYFWASLALIGENESLPKAEGRSSLKILAIIVVFFIACLSFFFLYSRKMDKNSVQ